VIAKAENPVEVAPAPSAPRAAPTVWGLDPVQLHDRFWAQHGVQVVRPDEGAAYSQAISSDALLYLLVEPRVLVTFESGEEIRTLYSSDAELTYVRIHDPRGRGYRERVITDSGDNFLRFERSYNRPQRRLIRAAFTPDRRLAEAWRGAAGEAEDSGGADVDRWSKLRERVPRRRRSILVTDGVAYDRRSDAELARLVRDLTRLWAGPGWMIPRAAHVAPGVWADKTVALDPKARFVGPVWIGAGRKLDPKTTLIGPFVLWDDPAARPQPEPIVWPALRHLDLPATRRPANALGHHHGGRIYAICKRVFDVLFGLFSLAITLPLYPLICVAIWLEDGRPFFFAHRRETRGGREFPCLKFRSMHSDAERMKQQLAGRNQADGPQFFMVKDVRVTRVGRFLRMTRLDELPQFLNVLIGHMSVVGPRPSPYKENQFCPPWREARLSVRPGITGLWQVKRTRKAGQDFQEWIRYDIEYVENATFWLDVVIIFRTVTSIIGGLIPWRRRRGEI
jgi:lipopolysaccharide/colanic/teichoic acid biosynthesis glycosyltransferase